MYTWHNWLQSCLPAKFEFCCWVSSGSTSYKANWSGDLVFNYFYCFSFSFDWGWLFRDFDLKILLFGCYAWFRLMIWIFWLYIFVLFSCFSFGLIEVNGLKSCAKGKLKVKASRHRSRVSQSWIFHWSNVKTWTTSNTFNFTLLYYQAHARSARALRACALRALGLLLADGAPTVGRGKTFWQVSRIFLRKLL